MSDMRQLVGKRVVMTGGAANIGRASALLMARHGATVVIGDLDLEGALETVSLIEKEGGKALAQKVDVTQESEVAAFVDAAAEFMGGIDVGFFNAGLQRSGRVEEFSVDQWDALLLDGQVRGAAPACRRWRFHCAHVVGGCGEGRPWHDRILCFEGCYYRIWASVGCRIGP